MRREIFEDRHFHDVFMRQREINHPYWGNYGRWHGCHHWDGRRDWLTIEIMTGIWIDLRWEQERWYWQHEGCSWDWHDGYWWCYRPHRVVVYDYNNYYDWSNTGGSVILVPTASPAAELPTPAPAPVPGTPVTTKRMYYSDDGKRLVQVYDADNKAALYDLTQKDENGADKFLANLANYVVADQLEAGVQGVKFLSVPATDENGGVLRNEDGSLQLAMIVEIRHEVAVSGEVSVQVDQYDAWGNLWQTVPNQNGNPPQPVQKSAEQKGMKIPSALERPISGRIFDNSGAR